MNFTALTLTVEIVCQFANKYNIVLKQGSKKVQFKVIWSGEF